MQNDGKKKRNKCRSKPEEKGIYTFQRQKFFHKKKNDHEAFKEHLKEKLESKQQKSKEYSLCIVVRR